MTIATAEKINEARMAVIAMIDALRPWLDDPVPRAVVLPAYDAAMASLADALHEATKPNPPTVQWRRGIEARRHG